MLARDDVDSRQLLDILGRIECHVYTAEALQTGGYHELFTGPAVDALLGGTPPDGVSLADAWLAAIHPDDVAIEAANDGGFADGLPTSVEYRLIGYDGVTRWVLDRMWPRPVGADGRRIFDGVVTDITQLREALDEAQQANNELSATREIAEQQARTDELTGLSNRRHFTVLLKRHLSRAAHDARGISLLLIDIDYFKQINDVHGHFAGDELLRQFAQRLAETMRPGDVVARWGGEEFVALLPDARDEGVLRARAEQIRAQLCSRPYDVDGAPVDIRASIGGALTGDNVRTAQELLAAADSAMYEAKRNGRDRVSLAPRETTRLHLL
ncbi:MAG: sensor domain-containing diguanylate cyclase [Actinomycetota bacterium]